MALSTTDDYNLTRDQIIRAAFETIGVAVTNEPLNPDDVSVGKVAFNALAMSYKAFGLHLWKRGRDTLDSASTPALVAGTAKYDLAATTATDDKPMRLLDVNRKDSSGNEVSMTRLTLEEYEALPNKTTQGTPLNYYFEPTRTTSYMYLWPTPDATFVANDSIEYVYQAPIREMSAGTDDVDFPNEWYRALILNLAVDLAPKYGLSVQERQLLKLDADEALELARDYDVEDGSIFIQPNARGRY